MGLSQNAKVGSTAAGSNASSWQAATDRHKAKTVFNLKAESFMTPNPEFQNY